MSYRHPYRRQPCRRKRGPLPLWLRRPMAYYSKPNTRRGWSYWRQLYWATPPWLTDGQIARMAEIRKNCPKGWHVDHEVPLNHPRVCGLNVPWNLRYLQAAANMSKSNHTWPDSPHENHDLFGIGVEQLELRI